MMPITPGLEQIAPLIEEDRLAWLALTLFRRWPPAHSRCNETTRGAGPVAPRYRTEGLRFPAAQFIFDGKAPLPEEWATVRAEGATIRYGCPPIRNV
jgi:hypothetical protein